MKKKKKEAKNKEEHYEDGRTYDEFGRSARYG